MLRDFFLELLTLIVTGIYTVAAVFLPGVISLTLCWLFSTYFPGVPSIGLLGTFILFFFSSLAVLYTVVKFIYSK